MFQKQFINQQFLAILPAITMCTSYPRAHGLQPAPHPIWAFMGLFSSPPLKSPDSGQFFLLKFKSSRIIDFERL